MQRLQVLGAALTLALVALGLGHGAAAAVIIDADVEDDGDWSGLQGWGNVPAEITPAVQEGAEAASLNNAGDKSISQTFTGVLLAPGTYTVEFAIGDFNNVPFATSVVDFNGLGLGDASSATTPTPAVGGWELWTITWDVTASNPNLGSDLSFELSVPFDTPLKNLAFDGVGALSSSGNGFIVSYEPAVIIDADVEDDGDWSGLQGWGNVPAEITPAVQEGAEAASLNNAGDKSISQTFTGVLLAPGTYTVEFAIGDFNNVPFATSVVDFNGLGLGDASSATTPTPAVGGWELWTITWDVTASNPNLGSDLSFELSVPFDTPLKNLAFDGVGALSSSGNGFIVSFQPAPPAVPSLGYAGRMVLLASLLAAAWWSRPHGIWRSSTSSLGKSAGR